MQVILQLKRLGRKKVISVPYKLEASPTTLNGLLTEFVKIEVRKYNTKREERQLVSFLNPQLIQEQAQQGKVAFGDIENVQEMSVEKALAIALQAFEDGLYVVFIDGQEVKSLDSPIVLLDGTEVAFIRLTFLVGSRFSV